MNVFDMSDLRIGCDDGSAIAEKVSIRHEEWEFFRITNMSDIDPLRKKRAKLVICGTAL